MKLAKLSNVTLTESAFFIIREEGEGPQWNFDYSTYKHDPTPKILVLGAYRHPNTGNNLVGGINLNYLDSNQRDGLAKVLPQLMQASNLYQRYHLGKNKLPSVFNNFYRTYNAANIHGVTQDVFHPKYGMMRSVKDFLKKKIGGLFKSKAQRAKEAEPQFPSDLSGMKDTLDKAVNQLGLQVAQGKAEPDTPEMKAARDNFMKYKMDRARSMADIEKQEDEPLIQATQNFQNAQVRTGRAAPTQVGPQAATPQPQQVQAPQQPVVQPPQQPAPQTPQQMGASIEKERLENQRELTDPKNSLDLDGDGIPDDQEPPELDPETQAYFNELDKLDEAIVYYCPKLRRYLMEDFGDAIKGMGTICEQRSF